MKDHGSGTYHCMITYRHAPTDGSMRTYLNTVADRYRLRHFYALISLFSHDRVAYHCHPETILKIIATIKIVTISTRGILVFLHFDSMIIMLVGEFNH